MPSRETEELCTRILSGDRRALARLISRVETGTADAASILTHIYPRTGHAQVCGVTGPPGAGKSSLIWPLAAELSGRGKEVAVLAIDPSSPHTGGALLGDRVRQPAGAAGIFFRSMSNRARPGALSPPLRAVLPLLDAAGFDVVFTETVGAGQADVAVQTVAHTVIVVQVPGLGDDVQALKAGMLEIGDIFVVNKGDVDGADALVHLLKGTIRLDGHPGEGGTPHGWSPPVVKTAALRKVGVDRLADWVLEHHRWLKTTSEWRLRRSVHTEAALHEAVLEEVHRLTEAASREAPAWPALISAMEERRITPQEAARQWLRGILHPSSQGAGEAS